MGPKRATRSQKPQPVKAATENSVLPSANDGAVKHTLTLGKPPLAAATKKTARIAGGRALGEMTNVSLYSL